MDDGHRRIQANREGGVKMSEKQEVKKEVYVKPEMTQIESVDVITLTSIGLTG
jgi:hypothetical protein